ncbi:hypothetical protein [Pseudovibrio sp. JE062]|uniref:hypothetical protein n=1 Tax=Pseudovibrio sp. JE062 TaxID=439495 RepID=UPI000186B876|nr:hypothetical protein [Pseudovibrio sp. JE062]EEA92890.1 hypothetical protein PJE062_2038 [Pseudovibrio sp. JE062]
MRNLLAMLAMAFTISACGSYKPTSNQSHLAVFPIDKTKNYLIWRYGSVQPDLSSIFCKVNASGAIEDCEDEEESNKNKLTFKVFDGLLGSYRVTFKHDDDYFLMSYSEPARSGKYAFVSGKSGQGRHTFKIGDATFVSDFKPGTVTVIPYGWEHRRSEADLKRTVEASLKQAFGDRANILTVRVARKVPIDCTKESHGFLKGTETKCKLR